MRLRLTVTVVGLLLLLAASWWWGRPPRTLTVRGACDVRQVCSVMLPDQRLLQVRFVTPPQRLQPFELEVRGAPPDYVSFAMQGMDMGYHRYQLQPAAQSWRGRMALPACVAGRHDWLLLVHVGGVTAEFAFRVE